LNSCPFALLERSPDVDEIASLYWWRQKGCLDRNDLDVPTIRAIDAYAAGISAQEKEQFDK
jgi:hypothetical protein